MHNKTFAFLANPPIWFGLLPLWVCATSATFLNDATMNPQSYASKTFIILSMAAFLYFIYSLSSFSARRKRAREMTTDEVVSKDLDKIFAATGLRGYKVDPENLPFNADMYYGDHPDARELDRLIKLYAAKHFVFSPERPQLIGHTIAYTTRSDRVAIRRSLIKVVENSPSKNE